MGRDVSSDCEQIKELVKKKFSFSRMLCGELLYERKP